MLRSELAHENISGRDHSRMFFNAHPIRRAPHTLFQNITRLLQNLIERSVLPCRVQKQCDRFVERGTGF
jgi:hypothetical protein